MDLATYFSNRQDIDAYLAYERDTSLVSPLAASARCCAYSFATQRVRRMQRQFADRYQGSRQYELKNAVAERCQARDRHSDIRDRAILYWPSTLFVAEGKLHPFESTRSTSLPGDYISGASNVSNPESTRSCLQWQKSAISTMLDRTCHIQRYSFGLMRREHPFLLGSLFHRQPAVART